MLRLRFLVLAAGAAFVLPGCDTVAVEPTAGADPACDIPTGGFTAGAARDVIAALNDPPVVPASSDAASYLEDDDRVIGVLPVGADPLAVPLKVLWNHEVANLEWGGRSLAVTYCPNTGSSLAFDRQAVGGAEFGVSGLLLHDNLIMYDRRADESLWPQMSRAARCGPSRGVPLEMVPVIEMRWGRWRELHPDTKVAADPGGTSTSGVGPTSGTRRVLGVPLGDGLALPFARLDDGSAARALEVSVSDTVMVVFWDREARAAMAYDPRVGGERLTFGVEAGRMVDSETGSVWSVAGRALDGPLAGERLAPIPTAYVAYATAWADFHPRTRVWDGSP